MRGVGKLVGRLVTLVLVASMLWLPATAQDSLSILIARISGTVEVQDALNGGGWETAMTEQVIGSGWRLRTGANSKAQLVFPLDNVVILKENSVLYVANLNWGGGATIEATEGSLLVNLRNALSPGSEFELKTPTAMAVVRGTKYGADNIDEYDVTFHGYDGTTEIYGIYDTNHLFPVPLVTGDSVDVTYGNPPSAPYPSPSSASSFLYDAEDPSAFLAVEMAAAGYVTPLALISRDLDEQAAKLDQFESEWRRYERRDQTMHMTFLYAQVLAVWEHVDLTASDFADLQGEISADQNRPGRIAPLPALHEEIAGKLEALYDRLEEFRYDAEPLIIDNEDVLETLRGLIDPGDPALGLRWGLVDTDNDGVSDLDEIALGLDPMVSNDDGFIVLLNPDDGEEFDFPQTEKISFEFEELDTDLVESYNLVIAAGGREWTRRDISDDELVDFTPLVTAGGVFEAEIAFDGTLDLEWFITADIEEDQLFQAIAGNSPGFRAGFGATIASEIRQLRINTPIQQDVVIVDLDNAGPTKVGTGDRVRILGSTTSVEALGEWEIEVVYDSSLLEFDQGRRLGLFVGSTVFFSDEPGGVVVISGAVTRNAIGITGEGNIFELEFIALDVGDTTIEVDGLRLVDLMGRFIEAEPGRVVDLELLDQGQAGVFGF